MNRSNLEKKRWKEKVRETTEQGSARILTGFFQMFGVHDAAERFLTWADLHRKAMFGITISFLIGVVIFTFTYRPRLSKRTGSDSSISEFMDRFNSRKDTLDFSNKTLEFSRLFKVMKLKNELEALKAKGHLTKDDTLRIKQMYNDLKNPTHEAN